MPPIACGDCATEQPRGAEYMKREETACTANAGTRLTEVRLEDWRNFTLFNQPLSRRVFVAGPNASGKSKFLDAFKQLRDIARVGGGLQSAVKLRGGPGSMRSFAARTEPKVRIASRVATRDPDREWAVTCLES